MLLQNKNLIELCVIHAMCSQSYLVLYSNLRGLFSRVFHFFILFDLTWFSLCVVSTITRIVVLAKMSYLELTLILRVTMSVFVVTIVKQYTTFQVGFIRPGHP